MGKVSSQSKCEIKPSTHLSELYASQSPLLHEEIKKYVLGPKNVEQEVEYLERCISAKSQDLAMIIFISEIICRCSKKHSDLRMIMKVLVKALETYKEYEQSIFCLRIIKSTVDSKFYAPVSFYLLRILKNALSSKNTAFGSGCIDYDSVELPPDMVKSEKHQAFVIGEATSLLMRHLSTFSKNIGFPELAVTVAEGLRRIKTGMYEEFIENAIAEISKQRKYVLEKRNSIKFDSLNGNAISSFESIIERTL